MKHGKTEWIAREPWHLAVIGKTRLVVAEQHDLHVCGMGIYLFLDRVIGAEVVEEDFALRGSTGELFSGASWEEAAFDRLCSLLSQRGQDFEPLKVLRSSEARGLGRSHSWVHGRRLTVTGLEFIVPAGSKGLALQFRKGQLEMELGQAFDTARSTR